MIIYKITNNINGKLYIGQTTRPLKERWQEHCKMSGDCPALSNAMKKYGIDSFTIEIIDNAVNIEELNQKEEKYIKGFNSIRPCGYNLTFGGLNALRSEETKRKNSEKQLGEKNHNWGKKASAETRKKMSDARKGSKNHMWGKKMPDGHNKKMLDAQKGMSHPRLGKTFTAESRKKMSDAQKGRPALSRESIKCNENNIIYQSMTEAANSLNLQISEVSNQLKGKRVSCKGYTFSHVGTPKNKKTRKSVSQETKIKLSLYSVNKKTIVCNETGQIFTSLASAAKVLKVSVGSVCNMLKGRTKTCKGFTFSYVKTPHARGSMQG
jgi:group I intron endonuclease